MESAEATSFEAARERLHPYMVAIIEANGFKPMAALGEVCLWARPLAVGSGPYQAPEPDTTLIVTLASERVGGMRTYLMNARGEIEAAFYGDWIDPMVDTVEFDPAWKDIP